jgi:hypothetical protein
LGFDPEGFCSFLDFGASTSGCATEAYSTAASLTASTTAPSTGFEVGFNFVDDCADAMT